MTGSDKIPEVVGLDRVRELLRSGQHAEAEQWLREICSQPGADALSWFFLGALSGTRGDSAAAEKCFRKALMLDSGLLQARYNLGVSLRDLGRLEEARAELERVVAVQPNHAEACNILGHVCFRIGRKNEAERFFRKALAAKPGYSDALINLGNVLTSKRQLTEAEKMFRRALEIDPFQDSAVCNLGSVLVLQGRLDEAISVYQQAIAVNPTNVEAHVRLGILFKRLGKQEEAVQALREALHREPRHAEARFFLATLVGGASPPMAPADYITRLFDDYADTFDVNLVEKLQYRTPQALFDCVMAALTRRKGLLDVLDLGCGTGLCGPLFRPVARSLVGVDLSSKMLAKAHARGVYDELVTGELTAVLLERENQIDLAIAADVFVYIGELAPVFDAVARALRPVGLFAFSVEAIKPGEEGNYVLRDTGRFAHARTYIESLARYHGLDAVSCAELCIRMDRGQPIAGAIHVLRKH